MLGLDTLDRYNITPDTVLNKFVKRSFGTNDDVITFEIEDWSVPLVRVDGHIYAAMIFPVLTFFTELQLQKLQSNFCHSSAEKLLKLRKRGRPEDTLPETFAALQEIAKSCDPCQRI